MFDLTSTCVLFGRRNVGKSHMIRGLCYDLFKHGGKIKNTYNNQVDLVIVFSQTEGLQSNFDFTPTCFVHEEYDENIIVQLLEKQKELFKHQGRTSNIIIIIDDFAYDKKVWSTQMLKCFMNGRHFRLCFFITMQYVMQLPSNLRSQIDVVIALRENTSSIQDKMYKALFGCGFKNFAHFKKVFEEQTEDYGGLILVNNMSKKNSLQENVFKYRAPSSIPSFQMGRSIFWEWNKIYSKSRMTTSYNTHNAKLYHQPHQSNQSNENKRTQPEKKEDKKNQSLALSLIL